MKKIFLFLLIWFSILHVNAQTDIKSTLTILQECLKMNANSQQDALKLYENMGIIEYVQLNTQQRMRLADLQLIEVKANNAGFSVDIKCVEENRCINFIKNDTASTDFLGTAIQFNDAALANTFADNLASLITHFKTTEVAIVKILFKNAEGKTPILGVKKSPEKKEMATTPKEVIPEKELKTEATEDEPAEKPNPEKKTPSRPTRAEREEARADKLAEQQEKKEEAESERPKKQTRKSSKANNKEENEEVEEEKATEKKSSRAKRRAEKQADNEDADPQEEPIEKTPSRKSGKTSGNKIIEDVGDDANNGDAKTKSGNDFCSQLTNILQSGKENKFKAIEGKLTNADTKINDSKIKLKGARKNYLSWFKKERAFIAELKSGNDYELLLKDFENMQTQLDECLGAGWDMEDKSGSEEYAKLKTEVRDVEFKKENDETMPTIRIIFLEDNDKFSMFMRVK